MASEDKVTVKVIRGSISTWKDGEYKKGDVFETTREKALQIDPKFIEIIESTVKKEHEADVSQEKVPLEEPAVAVAEVSEAKPAEESTPKPRRVKHA